MKVVQKFMKSRIVELRTLPYRIQASSAKCAVTFGMGNHQRKVPEQQNKHLIKGDRKLGHLIGNPAFETRTPEPSFDTWDPFRVWDIYIQNAGPQLHTVRGSARIN